MEKGKLACLENVFASFRKAAQTPSIERNLLGESRTRTFEQRVVWAVSYEAVPPCTECGEGLYSTWWSAGRDSSCDCDVHEHHHGRFSRALACIKKLEFESIAEHVPAQEPLRSGFDTDETFLAQLHFATATCYEPRAEGADGADGAPDMDTMFALVAVRDQEEPNDYAMKPFDYFQLQARLFDTAAERDAYACESSVCEEWNGDQTYSTFGY